MKDPARAKQTLIEENVFLKQRIRDLKKAESERMRMEQAYKDSELKYRSLIEHSSDVVFCVDQNGEYKFVNQVFASIFGQTPDYFLGKTFWDIYPKEHADHRQAASSKVFTTGESQSVEVVVPLQDRTLYFIAKANPLRDETGKVVLNLTHATDITDRKSIERALAEEHERLSSILDGSPVSSFVIDLEHRVTAWNIVNEFFTGISKEDILGKPLDLSPLFKNKVSPALADLVLEMTDEEIMKRYGDKGIRKSNIHPQAIESIGSIWIKGKEHIMAIQATRIRDASGNVIGAIQCAQDITEQQRFEETLRKNEHRLHMIVQHVNDAFYVHDLKGNITDLNDNACRMMDYTREELLAPGGFFLIDAPMDSELTQGRRSRLLRDGFIVFEGQHKRKDGKIVDVNVSARIVSRDGNGIVQSFVRDITEQKNAKDILERLVKERTAEIAKKNKQLAGEIKKHKTTEAGLLRKEKELHLNSTKLQQLNAALKVLLKQREDDRRDLEEKVLSNVKHLINPNLETLKKRKLDPDSKIYVDILEQNLKNIISPFSHTLSSKYQNLTPSEIKVADMIRNGKTTKDMAEFMGVSASAINHHRQHIRNKLGILTQKINLRSHLLSLS